MNRRVLIVAFVSLSLSGCKQISSAQSLSSLRTIKVEKQTLLTLGAKLPQATGFCDWNEEVCLFKQGTFGGVKSMSLTKTKSGLISQFHFDYGVLSADAVEAQIKDYTRRLGKPSRESTTKEGESVLREIEWTDSATSFRLFYKTDRGQVDASASLMDNALTTH
jgi:hypothetical protein